MARMLSRMHGPQVHTMRPSSTANDQPSGRPSSGPSAVIPHREQLRVTKATAKQPTRPGKPAGDVTRWSGHG
jgi:hypothetical protein